MHRLLLILFCVNYTWASHVIIEARADPVVDKYRLPPKEVLDPLEYSIKLWLKEDFYESDNFTGEVSIEVQVGNEDLNEIVLHSYPTITISQISYGTVVPESPAIVINLDNVESDNQTHILKIRGLNESLKAGEVYRVNFKYEGKLFVDDLHGFYKSSYQDDEGNTHFLATTQFETIHSRRAFPSFDEPGFKSHFELSITHPVGYHAVSNMEGSRGNVVDNEVTTTFPKTPLSPTYLLAFVVSDFSCTEPNYIEPNNTIPHRICSRSNTAHTRDLSYEVSPKILQKLAEFTGIPYSEHGLTKMDQFAIPDFSAGAMENWGLVTYRETALLYDPKQSTNRNLQSITTVIAHEFAHQWFGNLVTCHWWSDTFLNEGFANYFEYLIISEVHPTWEMEKQFAIEVVEGVLSSDSSPTSIPISSPASTPAQISQKFNTISYSKGGSILRLIETVIGLDKFKEGLHKYLEDNKFASGTKEALWTALQSTNPNTLPEGVDLSQFVNNWVNKPGYPVISVKKDGNKVVLSQNRYFDPPQPRNNDSWYVPISYTRSYDQNKFGIEHKAWLEPGKTLEIPLVNDSWIILNNQQRGYYRVHYDKELLNAIYKALATNASEVHEVNRAQIVDDYFAFAKVSRHEYSDIFDLVSFLRDDSSYYPWYAFFRGFGYIFQRIDDDSLRDSLAGYVADLLDKVYQSAPLENKAEAGQVDTLKKALIVSWACKFEHKDCVDKSRSQFKHYRSTYEKPERNIRSTVYCTALRNSDDPQDWDFLWKEYLNTTLAAEKTNIIGALGCTRKQELIEKYLNLVFEKDSKIRQQDAVSVFSSSYGGNPENIGYVFDYIIENHQKLTEYFVPKGSHGSIFSGLAGRFTSDDQVEKLLQFAHYQDGVSAPLQKAAADAAKSTDANLKFTRSFEKQMRSFFLKSSGAVKITSRFGFIMIAIVAIQKYLL